MDEPGSASYNPYDKIEWTGTLINVLRERHLELFRGGNTSVYLMVEGNLGEEAHYFKHNLRRYVDTQDNLHLVASNTKRAGPVVSDKTKLGATINMQKRLHCENANQRSVAGLTYVEDPDIIVSNSLVSVGPTNDLETNPLARYTRMMVEQGGNWEATWRELGPRGGGTTIASFSGKRKGPDDLWFTLLAADYYSAWAMQTEKHQSLSSVLPMWEEE